MTEWPLITVITPTYNRASFLDETIHSVLDQNYANLEYIVLDDGSTDNTAEVLAKYEGQLTALHHENRGEIPTVNHGFTIARGEIITVVNSDDPLLPGALETAAAFLRERPNILLAYPDWQIIGPDSKPRRTIHVAEYDIERMAVLHDCFVGPGAFVRKHALEALGGRNPRYRFVSDLDLWLRLSLLGDMARIPATLATWRLHDEGTSAVGRGRAMEEEHLDVIREHFERPGVPQRILERRREAMGWAHYAAAYYAASVIRRWMHIAKFVLIRPLNVVSWWRRVRAEKPRVGLVGFTLRRFLRGPVYD